MAAGPKEVSNWIDSAKKKINSIHAEEEDEEEKLQKTDRDLREGKPQQDVLQEIGIDIQELMDITAEIEEVEEDVNQILDEMGEQERVVDDEIRKLEKKLGDDTPDFEKLELFIKLLIKTEPSEHAGPDQVRGEYEEYCKKSSHWDSGYYADLNKNLEAKKRELEDWIEQIRNFKEDLEILNLETEEVEQEIEPELERMYEEVLPALFEDIEILEYLDREIEDIEAKEERIRKKLLETHRNKNSGKNQSSLQIFDEEEEKIDEAVAEIKTIMDREKILKKKLEREIREYEGEEKELEKTIEKLLSAIKTVKNEMTGARDVRAEYSKAYKSHATDCAGRTVDVPTSSSNFLTGRAEDICREVSYLIKDLYDELHESKYALSEIEKKVNTGEQEQKGHRGRTGLGFSI